MDFYRFLILCSLLIFVVSCSKEKAKTNFREEIVTKTKSYYPSGKLEIECELKNGRVKGKCTGYYENGKIKSEAFWVNEKKEGVYKFYNPDGTLYEKSNWKAGKKNGSEIFYYENGKIEAEGNYLMGKPVGWFNEYNNDGLLKAKYEYVSHSKATNGKTVNQHIAYDKAGNIISKESHYLIYSNVPDTINIGKEYNLKIKLINPYYKSKMRLVKVCGEEGFSAGDPAKYKFIEGKDFEVTYPFSANKSGNFNLCGTIHDYTTNGKGDTTETKFRTILFERKYWVK